jgi:DNA-binding XRE family transcriptional regulator
MIVTAETKTKRRGPKGRTKWESRPVDPLAARVVSNVRRLRVAAGLTQEELAGRMGCDTSTIGQIEASTRPGMQTRTVVALAKALGVKVDDLLAE